MAILYGVGALQQSAASDKPFYFGFNTARSVANDQLFALWNGPTSASIKAAVDKDGKYYSAALTAGDILFAVAGGIANVRRLDSLAIGALNTVLTSSGTAPQWSGSLSLTGLAIVGNNGAYTQSALTGTTGTYSSWTNTSGALIVGVDSSVGGTVFVGASAYAAVVGTANARSLQFATSNAVRLTIDSTGLLTASAGLTVSAGDLTLGAAASRIIPGATSLSLRNNANGADNVFVADDGVVTLRNQLKFTAGSNTSLGTTDNFGLSIKTNGTVRWSVSITGDFAGDTTNGGSIKMGPAVSKLVAGATSFSLRNNADNADNLLVTDAGIVTVRSTLTVAGLVTANAGLTVASGQTLGLTGVTVSGTPTWSASQAITLSTAAQPNITSLGTIASLLVVTLTSATANPASAGVVRLANNEALAWRNSANSGDIRLTAEAIPASVRLTSASLTLDVGQAYQIAAVQVVGGRITGYAAMTGTPNKATSYDTATVTLPQLAGRVAQLQADLTTHGLIGA